MRRGAESCCERACPAISWRFPENGKAYCRATNECWDCMSCVKARPTGLWGWIPYQLGYHKATLRPIMGKDSITWKCRDIHGRESV